MGHTNLENFYPRSLNLVARAFAFKAKAPGFNPICVILSLGISEQHAFNQPITNC